MPGLGGKRVPTTEPAGTDLMSSRSREISTSPDSMSFRRMFSSASPPRSTAAENSSNVIPARRRSSDWFRLSIVDRIAATYDLQVEPWAAETYVPVARGLLDAHRQAPSAWADGLPTTFPDDPAPGVYLLPADVYHADPLRAHGWSANASTLRRILPPGCPELVQWERAHPEQRDAWDLGTVTHTMTLGTGSEIVEVAYRSWQYKDAKLERDAARERGAVALLTKDLAACRAMAAAVRGNRLAGGLLQVPGASEVTLVWRERVPGTDREVWAATAANVFRDETAGALDPENGEAYVSMLRRALSVGGFHQLVYVEHQSDLVEMADAKIRDQLVDKIKDAITTFESSPEFVSAISDIPATRLLGRAPDAAGAAFCTASRNAFAWAMSSS